MWQTRPPWSTRRNTRPEHNIFIRSSSSRMIFPAEESTCLDPSVLPPLVLRPFQPLTHTTTTHHLQPTNKNPPHNEPRNQSLVAHLKSRPPCGKNKIKNSPSLLPRFCCLAYRSKILSSEQGATAKQYTKPTHSLRYPNHFCLLSRSYSALFFYFCAWSSRKVFLV